MSGRCRSRGGSRMRSGIGTAVALVAVLLALPARADMQPGGDYVPGRIQVQTNPGVPISIVNARYGTTTVDSLPPLYLLAIPDGADGDTMLHQMGSDSCM